MKYVSSGKFTNEQLSISETITEISDCVNIVKDVVNKLSAISDSDRNLLISNLSEIQSYFPLIKHKVDVALEYVPNDVQEKEYL